MPSSWLNVPHFQQELEYSCVAACVRMVLAHSGDIRTEAELRLLLDTQPTGTRAGNLMRLSGSAFEVQLRPRSSGTGSLASVATERGQDAGPHDPLPCAPWPVLTRCPDLAVRQSTRYSESLRSDWSVILKCAGLYPRFRTQLILV